MIQLLAIVLLSMPLFGHAGDLLSVYQQAKQNDAQWAAANSLYLADSLIEDRGKSRLRPVVNASLTSGYSTYKSDATQLRIDPDFDADRLFEGVESCADPEGGLDFACIFKSALGIGIDAKTDEDYISSKLSLNLVQPIYDMGIWHDYKASMAAKGKANSDLRTAEQDLMVRAADAYFNVLRALEDMNFARADELALRRSLNIAKRRFEQGIDLETEVYDAQAAYDLRVGNLELARAQLNGARRDLSVLTNSYDNNIYVLQGDIPIVPPVPADGREWAEQALNYSPMLDSGRYQVELTKRDYHKKQAAHLPKVSLQAQFETLETEGGQGSSPASDSTAIGISVTMPLYQGGLISTEKKIAFYKYQEAKDRFLNEQLKVQSLAQTLHQLINANVTRIASLKRSVVSTANALRATQRSYEDGTRNISNVISVQTSLGATGRDLAQARYDYIMNSLKLKQVTGLLSEDDLVALNSWLVPQKPEKTK
jgi:outer membrane protein